MVRSIHQNAAKKAGKNPERVRKAVVLSISAPMSASSKYAFGKVTRLVSMSSRRRIWKRSKPEARSLSEARTLTC